MSTSPRRNFAVACLPALALLAAAVLGVPGCAYLREAIGLGPQKPKVQLADIAVTKASLTALELALTLRVDNPNDFKLVFSKLKYRMEAAGLLVADGIFDETIAVPAEGHALVKLPLTIDAQNALRLAEILLKNESEVFALLNATAVFDTPVGGMDVAFEDKRPLRKLIGR
jgi:LEA14-like dessication related protein